MKIKGKIHKTVVRPAKMYGIEGTRIKKVNEKRMGVAEMKMLRWLSGVTRGDRISDTPIKGIFKVTEVSKKMQEAKLRWCGHVLRRDEEGVKRRVMDMEVRDVVGEEDRRPDGMIVYRQMYEKTIGYWDGA